MSKYVQYKQIETTVYVRTSCVKAVSERQAKLSIEKQRMSEEKDKLQETVEALQQEVSQLTRHSFSLFTEG